ncbi:MAG: lauroyl acyltransferase [Magnetospiraceae bacterium]
MAAPGRSFKRLRRAVLYPLEGAVAHLFYGLAGLLPLDAASAVGGWLGKTIGPFIDVSNTARRNIHAAFPEKSAQEVTQIVKDVWENLGRTVFEFPHLRKMDFLNTPDRFELVHLDRLTAPRDAGQPGIFFSGHFANWEIPPQVAGQLGLPVGLVFRAPNNPYVARLFDRRQPNADAPLFAKGDAAARGIFSHLKKGGYLAILVDQKLNTGIPVPFFGRDAMTAPAVAQFALRLHCPLVPVQTIRLQGCRFRVVFHPPLTPPNTGDKEADVLALMAQVNGCLEDWIRQHPGQWLWLHERWPKRPRSERRR